MKTNIKTIRTALFLSIGFLLMLLLITFMILKAPELKHFLDKVLI